MYPLRIARICALASLISALLLAATASGAFAGAFVIASCQGDRMNYSTTAFADFATRGMKIKRACNPEGPGLRGLITANAIDRGRVARGAFALVTLNAPEGTRFTTLRWAGSMRRRDCRYTLQLFADAPDIKAIPLKNVRANQNCPQGARAQAAGYRLRTFNVTGATRIVQRVACVGGNGRKSCSARATNYIRTYKAEIAISDDRAPAVSILGDTALARGDWVSGTQPLNYDAADNVGVRMAQVVASGLRGGFEQRPCSLATPEGAFAVGIPCPNGPGRIAVDTTVFPEGTQTLVAQAQDAANNVSSSAPVTARVDNTAPARVDVSVVGGEAWRNRNDFAIGWTNPPEGDRAPITSAKYRLCAVAGGRCSDAEQTGLGIAGLGIQVPAPGEWQVSLWRGDQAGNSSEEAASAPVTLRYDPEPPQLGFETPSASDPTLIAVQVSDRVSGLADGAIEISRAGSESWQALATQREGDRLLARIDDAGMPAGDYVLRATARDQANNLGLTALRLDGQPMAIRLPLRGVSVMKASISRERVVVRTVGRGGKRQRIRRRETVLSPSAHVRFGRQVHVVGRLTNTDGQGIAGAEVQVLARSATSAEQHEALLHTDGEGRYSYTAAASQSRALRLVYAGSSAILPAQAEVRLLVPAASSLGVDHRNVLNGQAVTFGGRVRTLPVPAGGKLVELQVRLSGRWQTFRTARTDASGRWAVRYRFKRTRGVQRFRFRVHLPPEATIRLSREARARFGCA
jgi:hypothetical protein